MEKFTKSPWLVKGDWMITDSNDRLIAQFESLNDGLSNSNTPESFANAELIAAAPEMYAMIENGIGQFGGTLWARKAEELLAKARGE